MKKLLLIAAVGLTSIAFSQKGNTSSAGIAFKTYWQLKLTGGDPETQAKELNDAKVFIDKSFAHDDTKDDPKTLMYYGKIYVEIPFCAMMTGDEALSAISAEDALKGGFAALKRSKEVDAKGRYHDDVDEYCNFYRGQMADAGVSMYEKEEWGTASAMLIGAGEFGNVMGHSDSIYYFYGGIAAFNLDSMGMAEGAFLNTVEWGYQPGSSTYYLSQALQKQGKTVEAEKMLKEQVTRYPGDKDILIEMINFYIDSDRKEDAVKALNEVIALDPNNSILIYTAGTVYENMDDFDNAEASYMKALELNDGDVNTLSALGGLYFNKGADVNNAANKLEFGDPNYDKMVAESKDFFGKAVPFLEKSVEAAPSDVNLWIALRDAYGKAGMKDKFLEAKAKVTELSGK